MSVIGSRPGPEPGIASDRIYSLQDFKRVTGWESGAIRAARHQGLKIYYQGRRAFIYGGDFLEFLRSSAKTERS